MIKKPILILIQMKFLNWPELEKYMLHKNLFIRSKF